MTVIAWIKSAVTIPDSSHLSDLATWRHWSMNAIIAFVVIFTLPVYLIFILPAELLHGHYLLAGIEVVLYVIAISNIVTRGRTLFGKPAFWMPLLQLLILPYYYYWGPWEGATWLLMVVVLWAVYYGMWAAILSVAANNLTLSLLYWGMKPQSPGWLYFYADTKIGWPSYLGIISWISLVMGVAVGFLLGRIAQSLKHERRSKIQLQESEARFRGLFESNPNGIVVSDMQGRVQDVNRAFTSATGFKREALIGRPMIEMISDENQLKTAKQHLTALKAGILEDSPHELLYRHHNGSIHHALTRGWLVMNRESTPVAIGVHFKDISIEKNLSDQKSLLEKQLQQSQKMEAIGTLAGGIAHDFNNILSGIIGYAELAQMELAATEFKSRQYVDHLLSAGKRARDLVRQVLHFSRQEENSKGPLSVTSVVKEVVKLLRSTLPSTIKIDLRLEKNSMMIWADATQIHQVIMNLCTNAYQSIGDNPGTLGIVLEKVELKSKKNFLSMTIPPGEYVRLTVSDTGKGIVPDEIDKIFDPYYTTKEIGQGTGLGLSVSIGVVTQHGGLIEVQTAPEQGAVFNVYLPKEQQTPTISSKSESIIRTGKNEQIMVVDDESLFVGVVTEQLSSLGYGIEAFTGSREALQRFREASEKFQLVISDQTMPEMTGLQLLSEIREIRPDIPFIICTGYSDRNTENRLRQTGNLDLLMKPVTRRELASAVFEILNKTES